MSILPLLALVVFCELPPAPAVAEPVRDLTFFLRRLRTVDHLPRLEPGHTAMSSTWNREGNNNDSNDFKHIEGTRNVLLDTDGPGCIHRIFVGRVDKEVAGTRIQVFLDRSPQAVFDLPIDRFFDDRNGPLPYPLVFHKTYPGTLFPIPFARHCLIQLVNEEAKSWGTYWQVTYSIYPPGTNVVSLRWPFTALERAEVAAVCQTWLDAESEPPKPSRWTHEEAFSLTPGAEHAVPLDGCGVIREFQVATEPATSEVLRGLRMRITWDEASGPSVDVPVGYFFGHADHTPASEAQYSSLLLGVKGAEGYARFPMPFARRALISFQNQSSTPIDRVQIRLAVDRMNTLPGDYGRFHVTWREQRAIEPDVTRYGKLQAPVHLVFDQNSGPGKYVGTLLHVAWPHSKEWWGEGDWMFWTDEHVWPPSYHGTGTEEYFNCGWGAFDRKAVSGYVTTRPGHETVYSFHLNDSFCWKNNIRVAVETVGFRQGDRLIQREHPMWGTTAFWYGPASMPAGSRPDLISPR